MGVVSELAVPAEAKIQVNGASRRALAGSTVADLLAELGLSADKVAVELDLEILPRERWATTTLADGARLEIVHFVGGG